jgi:phage terminase large subunit GpA-like protein
MSRRNSYKVPVFSISTDTAKDVIYSRLCIVRPGPGFMNFPDWIDQDYVDQLTSERLVKKYMPGRGVIRTWQKIKGHERNEALDLEVYCLAALHIGGLGLRKALGERAERWAMKPDDAAAAKPKRQPPRPARKGWINRWRR